MPSKTVSFFILGIIYTIPLIYGARHPLVHALYTSSIVVFCGTNLLARYQPNQSLRYLFTISSLIPLLLLAYIFFSSISLPLSLLEILSHARAESLHKAKEIGGAVNQATALSYYAPYPKIYAVYGLSLLFLYFTVTPYLRSEIFLKKILKAFTIIGAFEACYGLLQAMNPELGVLWSSSIGDQFQGYARGTIIYRNQYALFLNLCWPAAAAYGLSQYIPIIKRYDARLQKNRKMTLSQKASLFGDKAVIPLFCSGLMMLAVLLSQSRAGIITMIFTCIIFSLQIPVARKVKIYSFITLLCILLTYGTMIGGFDEISHRFSQFITGAEGRFKIWGGSLGILYDHLLTGIGMGNYEFLSLVYLENGTGQIWFDRAHNEYLELLIELGLPVGIITISWLLYGFVKCIKDIRVNNNKTAKLQTLTIQQLAAFAAISSFTAFIIHGFVDLVWRLPANIVYMVILFAILKSTIPGKPTNQTISC